MIRDGSLTLFRVRGVPVRAHWTLLLVIPYLAVALSYQFGSIADLAGVEQTRLTLPPIVWGALLAAALFASVALHELAHTMLALRYGGRVRSITLMLIGGVSQISRAPTRPLHQALMAAAGPAASFAIGALSFVGYAVFGGRADLQMALFYVAAMNMTLGLFNLLPAFPMDGGRIFRAVLAARLGLGRATAIATAIGRLFAIGLGVLAILQVNLLLGLIALFIYSGATAEGASERISQRLSDLRVTDFLPSRKQPPVIGSDEYLDDALRRMSELDRLELVVVDRRRPIAVIEADDVSRLSRLRPTAPIGSLTAHLHARYVIVSETAGANEALRAAAEEGASYVVAVDPPATVTGLVGPRDIARTLELRAVRGYPTHLAPPLAS